MHLYLHKIQILTAHLLAHIGLVSVGCLVIGKEMEDGMRSLGIPVGWI